MTETVLKADLDIEFDDGGITIRWPYASGDITIYIPAKVVFMSCVTHLEHDLKTKMIDMSDRDAAILEAGEFLLEALKVVDTENVESLV